LILCLLYFFDTHSKPGKKQKMNSPAVDLGSIPKLPLDHPVIVAFSASRDMGRTPQKQAPAAEPQTVTPEAGTPVVQITIVIAQTKPAQ
jgi:hypothetical protein